MFMTSAKSGSAAVLALTRVMLCLGAPVLGVSGLGVSVAQAQSVPYWTSTTGFNSSLTSNLTSETNANAFGNFSSRYNFENGWFVGSERGNLNWGASNFSPVSAFGSASAFSYEGSQVGYNFKSAPVSIYAGLDALKYNNAPIVGSPFSAFDSSSANLPGGYRVNAGVEFRPTSNLSLSVGASFSQQPNDINSALLPGASPFAFRGR
jgi:hypothetical protein